MLKKSMSTGIKGEIENNSRLPWGRGVAGCGVTDAGG